METELIPATDLRPGDAVMDADDPGQTLHVTFAELAPDGRAIRLRCAFDDGREALDQELTSDDFVERVQSEPPPNAMTPEDERLEAIHEKLYWQHWEGRATR